MLAHVREDQCDERLVLVVRVRVLRQHLERTLGKWHRFGHVDPASLHPAELAQRFCVRDPIVASTGVDRRLEVYRRLARAGLHQRHPARAQPEIDPRRVVVGKLKSALVIALRGLPGRERRGVVAGTDEGFACSLADLSRVGRIRFGCVCLDEVSSDHLGNLVLLAPLALEVGGGGEVAQLAVTPRQRAVRDAADEVLHEDVLTAFGRPRV